jgi:hypothetical protein
MISSVLAKSFLWAITFSGASENMHHQEAPVGGTSWSYQISDFLGLMVADKLESFRH